MNTWTPISGFTNAPGTGGTYYIGACIDAVSNESNTGNQCSTDAECFGADSKCIQISPTDPRTFCGRDCSGGSGLSGGSGRPVKRRSIS